MLAAGWRDVPERQRSMRAVFDHSWRLLSEVERVTLSSLAVFSGGFTRRAATKVAGASPRGLESLAHKSLLSCTPAGRYGMHELLRQYLGGRLNEAPAAREAARNRHSAYFARALGRWAEDLKGEGQEAALAEMEIEIQNAQAAWAWMVEQGQFERLARAMESLCLFFEWRVRYRQGEAACRGAVEGLEGQASPTGPELRLLARLLAWQSRFVHYLEGAERARPLLQRSLAVLDDARLAGQDTRAEMAHAWWCQGQLSASRDREAARESYERCLALYRALGDGWGQANALSALGAAAWNLGDYREARRRHEASLAMRQELGDARGIANALTSVGVTALYQGEVAAAQQLVRRGCALRQALGDRRGHADGLRHLGVTHLLSGEFAEAAGLLGKSLAIYDDWM
jgi:tetratricopeptide (TPR) repeat protein